jgi:PBP1b-binding outer membrane lipoprotein LpoB
MKTTLLIVLIIMIFVGCSEPSLEQQKLQCMKDGNDFSIHKVLNFRTGEYELRGKCS